MFDRVLNTAVINEWRRSLEVFYKKDVLKNFQNSQQSTCGGVAFQQRRDF